jgi:levanbiose-producing levanase
MIAGAAHSTFLFQGCSSGSDGSTPVNPTPTPSASSVRPQYHLTPSTEWINDPQRPLWMNNTWNLWVLWNGDYPGGNGTAWRRYTSSDLMNWTDQGLSIPKYTTAYGDVWTGSTVVDTNGTASYGAGAIIALMTMPCNNLGGQSTALWYSTNGGASFTFGQIVQTNPQIAQGVASGSMVFRDPSVFWYAPGNRWVMSLAEIGKLSIYTSPDLTNWTYASGMIREDLGTMECPHLVQLHLYQSNGTTTGDKWVLLCGANGTSEGFTTGTAYWVGSFEGTQFTPDSSSPSWLDLGPDFYATTLFADPNASDPLSSIYAIAWENNWNYAAAIPTTGYWGQLSIVRELSLQMLNGAVTLLMSPISAQGGVFKATVTGTNQTISDSVSYSWPSGATNISSRIDFTLSPVGGVWPSAINLAMRSVDGYLTQLGFAPGQSQTTLARNNSGPVPLSGSAWSNSYAAPCNFSGAVKVSIFIDANSIEVFLNGGQSVMSALITAPSDAVGLNLTAVGGSATISDMTIRTMS